MPTQYVDIKSATSYIGSTPNAAGIGVVGTGLYFNADGTVRQVADLTSAQTLTNKTLTSPTLTSPTITTPTITGTKPAIVSGLGATLAPSAAQSGAIFVLDRAAGTVVTLPAPVVGLNYRFVVPADLSGTLEIDTDAGTTFLVGTIESATEAGTPSATIGPKHFTADGSSHVKYKADADTKGRLKGTALEFRCISATQWFVTGLAQASGTIATPFA